ncbi:MAG TPA: zinc ABC transporter substrate-binding protein [Syntrophobacteraceae bacterium]|nr:zinc ABC transporter substrate-binding protein [Syntrophobacteraceae bacterium]
MLALFLKTGLVLTLIFIQPGRIFAQAAAPMPVAVSILPQRYFVEKIGGQLVQVEVMVPPGAEMEAYEPKPAQMSALSRAKIYFALGVQFETVWLSKMVSANPKIIVIHTEKDIKKRTLEAHAHLGEVLNPDRGRAGAHEEASDPHIWLSPPLVILQARAIFEALAATDPADRAVYETNYRQFVSELVELDLYLFRIFGTSSKPREFLVFHPAWGYFADAYGLKQVPVQVEGREPKARELDEFIKGARELGAKVIFIEPQYSPKTAQTIAEALGGRLAEADDLAPDWEKNLRRVAEQIKSAVSSER